MIFDGDKHMCIIIALSSCPSCVISSIYQAFDRLGVKCSQKDATILFDGMDRRNTGSIDISSLIEIFYPAQKRTERDRDGGVADRGRERGSDRGRDRGSDRSERGSSRDNENTRRGSRVVLKRNEARLVLRKRPDLLEEVQLQMRGMGRERG